MEKEMKKESAADKGEIVVYQPDEVTRLEVRVNEDTVWLTQDQIALLFGVQRPAVTKHIRNIISSKELEEDSVSSILEHTAADGKKYATKFYNLDAILSVGYRVNSVYATSFRRWANNVLKKYLLKGYAVHPSLQQVEYHLSKQIESQREEMFLLQQKVQNHEQKIDFLIQKAQPTTEQIKIFHHQINPQYYLLSL